MRFLFYPERCIPLHRNILEKPLGGMETAIISLALALAELGNEVWIVSDVPDRNNLNPFFVLPSEINRIPAVDILVSARVWGTAFIPISKKKVFYWTGDNPAGLYNYGIGDPRVISFLNGVWCMSQWQGEELCRLSGFPRQKMHILRNGINLENYKGHEERHRKRLIYTSHPSRGLKSLSIIFERLKKKHKDLELHIFGGDEVHGKANNSAWDHLLQVYRKMPGCVVHGSVPQHILAREFMKASIWTFPTFIPETSCISAMEAQAGGCAIVTSALGALPETVNQAGILIADPPTTPHYLDSFTKAVDRLLSDDVFFNKLSTISLEQAQSYDWKLRAEALLKTLQ